MEKGKSIESWRRKDTGLKVFTYDGWFTLIFWFLKQWVNPTVFLFFNNKEGDGYNEKQSFYINIDITYAF